MSERDFANWVDQQESFSEGCRARDSEVTQLRNDIVTLKAERDALKSRLEQAEKETAKLRGIIDASNQTLGMYEADNAKLREIARVGR